ncbi:MAG: SDR family oxidoreductase [Desulfovibrionaceae bacterium]|nr:SDR family oxidoreductase [Desulfovibrionaceae bacterium]
MKIDGAIALVTGGCGNLGRYICDDLHSRGVKVIVADINKDTLAALPPHFASTAFDVTKPDDTKKAVAELIQTHGHIDILVNCAGSIVSAPFANILSPDKMMLSYEKFRHDVMINLDSVFIVTAAVVEWMIKKRTRGCIINISSISARGNAGQTAYAAAKAGVNAMTITWAKELGMLGIRCNAVAPGFIDTPSTHMALQESQIKHIINNTPLRSLGAPEDVAQAVSALIANDFCNGVIFDVNGGLSF